MPFVSLTFELGTLGAEQVEETCFATGALSVTLTDCGDDPVLEPAPGEVRLWPATRVQALYAEGTDVAAVKAVLSSSLGVAPEKVEHAEIADRAWEREWLRDFHALRFGRRLWVTPHHEEVTEPGAIVVRLDPGLAFGTGTHPTTALCLEWLDAHLQPGQRVIDYGCGSGILAIAALKLGAKEASCFDIDPQALIATRDNAEANGVLDKVLICQADSELPQQVDVVLANILSGPLCTLAPRLAELVKPGGFVVLAGLMQHEAAEVTEAYNAWFDIRPFGAREDWVCLTGSRRESRR